MSNCYTQFSFAVKTTDEEHAFLETAHNMCVGSESMLGREMMVKTDGKGNIIGFDTERTEGLTIGELNFARTTDGSATIIYADENGDIEYTCALLQVCLEAFNCDTIVSFEWADTCSASLPDQFGGGACAVSKDAIEIYSTQTARDELIKILSNRLEKERSPS